MNRLAQMFNNVWEQKKRSCYLHTQKNELHHPILTIDVEKEKQQYKEYTYIAFAELQIFQRKIYSVNL